MPRASFCVLVLLVSCSSPRAWVYAPQPRQPRAPLCNASLVVPPFLDRRGTDNTDALLLGLMPLMPCGWQDLQVPEAPSSHAASGQWRFAPADDIARAFAQEIDAARIFREAFPDPRASTGDYVLTGEVRSTQFDSVMLTYGLSFYSAAVWLVGLPAAHTYNELELHLTLRSARSEEPLWQHSIRESDSDTGWIYALGSDFMYDQLLKRAMPAALASLEQAVRALPAR